MFPCNNKFFEFSSVDVSLNSDVIRLTCFYIPPCTVANFNDFVIACNCLLANCQTVYPHYICGDFNLPNIDWTAHISLGDFAHDHFIDVCYELGLTQHIQSPIHLDGNILDLLLCDASSSSRLLTMCPPFLIHVIITSLFTKQAAQLASATFWF